MTLPEKKVLLQPPLSPLGLRPNGWAWVRMSGHAKGLHQLNGRIVQTIRQDDQLNWEIRPALEIVLGAPVQSKTDFEGKAVIHKAGTAISVSILSGQLLVPLADPSDDAISQEMVFQPKAPLLPFPPGAQRPDRSEDGTGEESV